MARTSDEFLLTLLQACARVAPQPLYPVHFAREALLDRDRLDEGLDELRRRGFVQLTEWVKDSGQGCALTPAGLRALALKRLEPIHPHTMIDLSAPNDAPSSYERGEAVRASILEPKLPYVSRLLLALNLLYFLYGAFFAWQHHVDVIAYLSGSPTATVILAELGGLHPVLVFPPHERPQFERILLSMFLHGGLLHLGMNMYFLFSFGPLIEGLWGSLRFLLIYVSAGIVSGCTVLLVTLWQHHGALTIGASGALFGIFASFVAWFLLNRRHLPTRLMQAWSRNIGTNVVLLLVISIMPGISWQAHLGGALGGFLTALLLHVQRFAPNRGVRMLALLALPVVPAAFFAAVLWEVGWI